MKAVAQLPSLTWNVAAVGASIGSFITCGYHWSDACDENLKLIYLFYGIIFLGFPLVSFIPDSKWRFRGNMIFFFVPYVIITTIGTVMLANTQSSSPSPSSSSSSTDNYYYCEAHAKNTIRIILCACWVMVPFMVILFFQSYHHRFMFFPATPFIFVMVFFGVLFIYSGVRGNDDPCAIPSICRIAWGILILGAIFLYTLWQFINQFYWRNHLTSGSVGAALAFFVLWLLGGLSYCIFSTVSLSDRPFQCTNDNGHWSYHTMLEWVCWSVIIAISSVWWCFWGQDIWDGVTIAERNQARWSAAAAPNMTTNRTRRHGLQAPYARANLDNDETATLLSH